MAERRIIELRVTASSASFMMKAKRSFRGEIDRINLIARIDEE